MSNFGKVTHVFVRVGMFFLKKVWIPLSLLLVVQIGLLYIAVSEIEIPAELLRPLLNRLSSEGVFCSVGEVRLRNLTVVTAKDIRVETLGRREPLITLRRCAVKLGPDALISRNFIPQFLFANGLELYCPATHSETGRSERVIRDGLISASRSRGEIKIEAADFRAENLEFVAYGTLPGRRDFFLSESNADGVVREKLSAQIARAAGILAVSLQHKIPGKISVVALLENGGNVADIDLNVFCPQLNFSENVRASEISARQSFAFKLADPEIFSTSPLYVSAKKVDAITGENFSEKIYLSARNLALATQIPEELFSGEMKLPSKIFARAEQLRATSFSHGNLDLQSALISISPREHAAFPQVFDFSGNVFLEKTSFVCAGTLDATKTFVSAGNILPSLNFGYTLVPDKDSVLAFPQLREIAMQKEFRALRFDAFPEIRGNVRFSDGMQFENTSFEFLSGALQCENIELQRLRIAGDASARDIHVRKIQARGNDFLANADVFTQFSSAGDFRIRAWGTIDPSYLDGHLGWFWERIWRDLRPAPSEILPRADIDVYGNWGENWEYVFGAIAGENCYGNGVLVDKVRLRVFEDPELIAAFDMGFVRGNDLVTGTLQWHYAMQPVYHYRDFRFLFNGSIPPKDVLQIVGEGLPEALSELETAGAGTAVVSGLFSGDPAFYPERMLVNVKGRVPGDFSIFGIDGKDFEGEIRYDNGVVFVGNPFHAKNGDGSVSGFVRVTLPETEHSALGSKAEIALDLKNIRRSRLTKILSELGSRVAADSAENSGVPAASPGENEPAAAAETEDRSCIDATFAGTLTIPELHSLDASGNFSLREEDLFELQIFGGFSKLLSSLKFDLTTFALNQATGNYTIRNGTVFLPDLRVFGESGEIDVQADVSLPDLSVQGEAVFRNLRGTRIPLLGTLVKWGSASTELLPVKIGGNIENLEWEVTPSLSRIWSSSETKFGIAPEKSVPAPADNPESAAN